MDEKHRKYLHVMPEGTTFYNCSRPSLMKIAAEANALVRIGRRVLINREKLDAYLEDKASTTN